MSELRRIGVFGGTFDPIHNTHCAIARAALREAGLDLVYFVVSARPPHKHDEAVASAEDRLAMVRAAIQDEPDMEASPIELERTGPSYTVDTLRQLEQRFPGTSLFLIIGLDSLVDFLEWRDPLEILNHAKLLVVPRPGLRHSAPEALEGRYQVLPFCESAVSSTDIRARIARGEPIEDLVPLAVTRYIKDRGIYGVHNPSRPR